MLVTLMRLAVLTAAWIGTGILLVTLIGLWH